MSTPIVAPILRRNHAIADRRFYLVMALASTVLIFIGFSPSYYLKAHFPHSPVLTPLVHLHGAVFTIWMLYFVLQTALIAVRKPRLHRNLGIFGTVLAGAMVVLGLAVAVAAFRLRHGTPAADPETIFLVALGDIFTFGLFFLCGYVWRRNREAHQRLMLLAVVAGLLDPALGRLAGFGVPGPALALTEFAFLLAGPMFDLVTRRRVHRVYVFGVLFAVLTIPPLRFVVGATPAWHHIAHAITGVSPM